MLPNVTQEIDIWRRNSPEKFVLFRIFLKTEGIRYLVAVIAAHTLWLNRVSLFSVLSLQLVASFVRESECSR